MQLIEGGWIVDDAERLIKVRDFARRMVQHNSFANMDHVERVRNVAIDIARRENADLQVVEIASWLHDIGVIVDKGTHYDIGAELSRGFLLGLGYDADLVEQVCHAIATHSRYGGADPETIEAKVLQDADAVEYVGAIGLARAFVRDRESAAYDGDVAAVPAMIDRLIGHIGHLYTQRARELIDERIAFMRLYQSRLVQELAGEV